jgi:outer membrane protein assembly factor BamB
MPDPVPVPAVVSFLPAAEPVEDLELLVVNSLFVGATEELGWTGEVLIAGSAVAFPVTLDGILWDESVGQLMNDLENRAIGDGVVVLADVRGRGIKAGADRIRAFLGSCPSPIWERHMDEGTVGLLSIEGGMLFGEGSLNGGVLAEFLWALDADSGLPLWNTPAIHDVMCYAKPALIGDLAITARWFWDSDDRTPELVALDIATGQERWVRALAPSAWPYADHRLARMGVIAAGDKILVPTRDGRGCVWQAWDADGNLRWISPHAHSGWDDDTVQRPLLFGDILLLADVPDWENRGVQSTVAALDLADGAVRWIRQGGALWLATDQDCVWMPAPLDNSDDVDERATPEIELRGRDGTLLGRSAPIGLPNGGEWYGGQDSPVRGLHGPVIGPGILCLTQGDTVAIVAATRAERNAVHWHLSDVTVPD